MYMIMMISACVMPLNMYVYTQSNRSLSFIPVSYAQIDWHDFVVVETVDFQPNEQGG